MSGRSETRRRLERFAPAIGRAMAAAATIPWRGTWSGGRTVTDKRPRLERGDLARFVRRLARGLVRRTKNGPYVCGATFVDGGRRAASDVEGVNLLGLDLDHAAPTPEAAAAAFGCAAVVHSSYSDQRPKDKAPPEPRYRVFVPFAKAVTGGEFRLLWLWAIERFEQATGCVPDKACKDPSRLWFTLRDRADSPDPPPWVFVFAGPLLDPDALPDGASVGGLVSAARAERERRRFASVPLRLDETAPRRAAAALDAAARAVLCATDGAAGVGRHDTLVKQAVWLGRFVAAGVVSESEVLSSLGGAARAVLPESRSKEIPAAIAWGLEKGRESGPPDERPSPTTRRRGRTRTRPGTMPSTCGLSLRMWTTSTRNSCSRSPATRIRTAAPTSTRIATSTSTRRRIGTERAT